MCVYITLCCQLHIIFVFSCQCVRRRSKWRRRRRQGRKRRLWKRGCRRPCAALSRREIRDSDCFKFCCLKMQDVTMTKQINKYWPKINIGFTTRKSCNALGFGERGVKSMLLIQTFAHAWAASSRYLWILVWLRSHDPKNSSATNALSTHAQRN